MDNTFFKKLLLDLTFSKKLQQERFEFSFAGDKDYANHWHIVVCLFYSGVDHIMRPAGTYRKLTLFPTDTEWNIGHLRP